MSNIDYHHSLLKSFNTQKYIEASTKFLPKEIKILFIAESPPYSPPDEKEWHYFYHINEDEAHIKSNKHIFRNTIAKTIYKDNLENNEEVYSFLKRFQSDGYFLIDSVEYPINKFPSNNNPVPDYIRSKIILIELRNLIDSIKDLIAKNRNMKIILIKATVYKTLLGKKNTFNDMVLNGTFKVKNINSIPFPIRKYGLDKKFIIEVRKLLKIKY